MLYSRWCKKTRRRLGLRCSWYDDVIIDAHDPEVFKKRLDDGVKGYVNYVSMSEYGLDCQSRRSKSCVVNDGALSTEVLRVAIGYRSTRSKLLRLFG